MENESIPDLEAAKLLGNLVSDHWEVLGLGFRV